MSFLVNLAKRKKSPEQLVKLAVACLHEMPRGEGAGEGDLSSSRSDHPHSHKPSSGEDVVIEDKSQSEAVHDELMHSAHSISSHGSNPEFNRAGSTGSDGGAPAPTTAMPRRPSFLLGGFRRDSGDAHHSSEGDHAHGKTRPLSISVSKGHLAVPGIFFSDPGKKHQQQQAAAGGGTVTSSTLHYSSSFGTNEDPTVLERLAKRLSQMKLILYGDGEKEVDKEKSEELASHIIKEGMIPLLMDHFTALPFEGRKDAAQIFNNLCRHNLAGFADPYIANEHFSIVVQLINGYSHPEVALNCGAMLRESIRHDKIARRILFSEHVWPFFDTYVHLPNFDVASDSFATLRDLLTRHKAVAAEFLEQEFDQVFTKYKSLLKSENYVTRRMSLKMLGELLLDRSNFNTMMRYISSKENLKTIMILLRDKKGSISFEAFHVFKVFVANPKKPTEIVKILGRNREKLVTYLGNFHNDKDDEQFREEKALLISTLAKLDYVETEGGQEGATSEGVESEEIHDPSPS